MRARDTSPTLKVMPRDQETDVPRDATLLFTAPRRVDHLSASGLRVRTEDRDVEGVLDISSDGRILFWRPIQAMEARARHRITLSGVRDERGTVFDDLSSTFVTGGFSYLDLLLMVE
jgi:hypothetical protein